MGIHIPYYINEELRSSQEFPHYILCTWGVSFSWLLSVGRIFLPNSFSPTFLALWYSVLFRNIRLEGSNPPTICGAVSSQISIDWFKGKITGKSHISWESLWFPVDFPFSQPIDFRIIKILLGIPCLVPFILTHHHSMGPLLSFCLNNAMVSYWRCRWCLEISKVYRCVCAQLKNYRHLFCF